MISIDDFKDDVISRNIIVSSYGISYSKFIEIITYIYLDGSHSTHFVVNHYNIVSKNKHETIFLNIENALNYYNNIHDKGE